MLTGDSLFVGDAARPDLAVEAVEGAEGLFHSLRRLVELGDGVEVYPGHVAGSLCGAAMSSKPSTTIGFERRFNHALAETHDDFMASERAAAAAPAEHGGDRRAEPRAFLACPAADRSTSTTPHDAVGARRARGARLRSRTRRGRSTCLSSGSAFGTKAAFVLPERAVVIDAADEQEAQDAARAPARSASSTSSAGARVAATSGSSR